uniref:Uncharacterized protein n=1 Tax=Photinus pyralis TaxID=7054 RepID=A0A1Y1NDZ4_PHOPY
MTATHRTPRRSDISPHVGHATRATISSAKPKVPTTSPTFFFWPMRSVMTNDTELLRKTRNDMEKSEMPRRYVTACAVVADGAKGKYRDSNAMIQKGCSG